MTAEPRSMPPTASPRPVTADPAAVGIPRRGLLRGSAIAAGAAVGGVAVAGLSVAGTAHAADGDPVLAGEANESTATTGIRIGGATGTEEPALTLENENGPSLFLQPLPADFAGFMGLGQVANTTLGPVIGVDTVVGETTTYLATGVDLLDLPTPVALERPIRVLDTSTAAGRARVFATSPSPYDSAFRLKGGAYLDVEVSPAVGDYQLPSVFLNVVVIAPTAAGYVSVYRPHPSVGPGTQNYQAKQTIGNFTMVAPSIAEGRYVVRVWTSKAARIILDLTGFTVKGNSPTPGSATAATQSSKERAALGSRLRSALVGRVRSSLDR